MNEKLLKKILIVVIPYLLITTSIFVYSYFNTIPYYYSNFPLQVAVDFEQNLHNGFILNIILFSIVLVFNYTVYSSLNIFKAFQK